MLKNKEKLSSECLFDKNIYATEELDELKDEITTSIKNGNGKMFLRDVDCGYTDFIVLNGKYTGTVWSEELAVDGAVRMINTTFYEYVLENYFYLI